MAKKPAGLAVRVAIGKSKPSGDFASPSDMSASSMPGGSQSSGAPSDMDPDSAGDDDTGDVTITPEAVNYHDDEHRCDGCSYYGQDGNCAVLKMPVQAEGGCNAFTASGASGGDDGSGMPPASPGPMGTNGGGNYGG